MKKLAFAASLLASTTLFACGGDDGAIQLPDASVQIDGGGNAVCDVLAGTGCADDEKCTFIIDLESTANLDSVCLKAGNVPQGGTCSYAEVTATTRQDMDCVKGTQCFFSESRTGEREGTCRKIAADEAFSCDDEGLETVDVFTNVFKDQPRADIGFCFLQCDPLLQNECINDPGADDEFGTEDDRVTGCFRKFYTQGPQILDVDFACFFVDTVNNVQVAAGDECVGPDAESCFLNGVPRGTTLMFTGIDTKSVVTPYCRVQAAHLETNADEGARVALANGDPTPIEGERPGDCSATNFATGDGVNGSQWECTAWDEAQFLGRMDSSIFPTAAAGVPAAFTALNDKYDLPTGVGTCVDTTLLGVIETGGDPVQIYPTVTAFDVQNVRDDIADGTLDTKIGELDYEFCIDCLTMEGWIELVGAGLNRINQIIGAKAVRAKAMQKVMTIAPLAPNSGRSALDSYTK